VSREGIRRKAFKAIRKFQDSLAPTTKRHHKSLKIKVLSSPSLPRDIIKASKKLLKKLDDADESRKHREEVKNTLETQLFTTRSYVRGGDHVDEVTTEEQREALLEEVDALEDWLYEDGEHASVDTYSTRLSELSEKHKAIELRASELTRRPKSVSTLRAALHATQQQAAEWLNTRPQILEDDHELLNAKIDDVLAWLDDMESKQSSLEPHEVPAFTSKDVQSQIVPIESFVKRLLKRPPPAPAPAPADASAADAEGDADALREESIKYFNTIDADNDGVLTGDELSELTKSGVDVAKWDTDGDNALSQAEYVAGAASSLDAADDDASASKNGDAEEL